ncbi:selenoneine synthase SenA [Rhodoferax sp.]|uniref:selenoneine synthase SenA n=1 Tax=Rhodoferax sp. TaxID=50421 RepID=UPI001A01D6B6|nr:selenoneine synthase SenA [Rhodoferax sp.]MBE0472645.1 ergothioneine biosynthesis protein EgtB [Rhodoferax sp.]
MFEARQLFGVELAAALRESRQRTLLLVNDLSPAQWSPPRQIGINPVAWELAHIAWFAEFWILRGPHHCDAQGQLHAAQPACFVGPDALFDSARLAHTRRWAEAMPTRAELAPMLVRQLEACIAALALGAPEPSNAEPDPLYFHRLALFHEDMHGEAFCWMRSALCYPAPVGVAVPHLPEGEPLAVPGTEACIGWRDAQPGFAFDNERPAMSVRLADYEIDSTPLSAGEFVRFVEAGGYDTAAYWPLEAGVWRKQSACSHPQRWRRGPGGDWQMRWFDQWLPLDSAAPAMHLNAFEAQAYCLWAGRRLPSASEWEYAATSQPGFQWGHSVWEWTSSAFAPYPGFTAGPYHAYSQPWFGNHRELRGGAFASHARMHHPRYRNFFEPHRTDVFAGFRTVAL